MYLYIRQVGIKFDFIDHDLKLEFVDSGLYFFQDENYFIYPLLRVGSGSDEQSLGSGSGRPRINGSDRIHISGSAMLLLLHRLLLKNFNNFTFICRWSQSLSSLFNVSLFINNSRFFSRPFFLHFLFQYAVLQYINIYLYKE